MNIDQAAEHLRRDITYPITADGICELCDNLRHFSAEDRKWIYEHIPPGIYATPEDAIRAVAWGLN